MTSKSVHLIQGRTLSMLVLRSQPVRGENGRVHDIAMMGRALVVRSPPPARLPANDLRRSAGMAFVSEDKWPAFIKITRSRVTWSKMCFVWTDS